MYVTSKVDDITNLTESVVLEKTIGVENTSIEVDMVESKVGTNGFGYDPIFQPESYDRTFAEMEQDEKNLISHRARALEKMKKILEPYFNKGEDIG